MGLCRHRDVCHAPLPRADHRRRSRHRRPSRSSHAGQQPTKGRMVSESPAQRDSSLTRWARSLLMSPHTQWHADDRNTCCHRLVRAAEWHGRILPDIRAGTAAVLEAVRVALGPEKMTEPPPTGGSGGGGGSFLMCGFDWLVAAGGEVPSAPSEPSAPGPSCFLAPLPAVLTSCTRCSCTRCPDLCALNAQDGSVPQPMLLEVNTSPQLMYPSKFVGWNAAIDAMMEELVRLCNCLAYCRCASRCCDGTATSLLLPSLPLPLCAHASRSYHATQPFAAPPLASAGAAGGGSLFAR